MIEFVSREYVFQKCPQLAHQLMGYQQAMFNPSEDLLVEGEEVFLGSDTLDRFRMAFAARVSPRQDRSMVAKFQ